MLNRNPSAEHFEAIAEDLMISLQELEAAEPLIKAWAAPLGNATHPNDLLNP